ncbi:MAG TPA: amidohydrolase family protein [Candidatus Sumerlaeota bacterium]|nr:amidohydrolase family protein [Candidatus Sumerlaeota bacterium]
MDKQRILIRRGTILDGTGAAPRDADLLLENGVIAAIGALDGVGEVAETIDAAGSYVAPGFIDIHSHSDFTLLVDPRAVSSISQGVTTEIVGNCGHGCAPIHNPISAIANIYGYQAGYDLFWRSMAEYLESLEQARPALNVATLVPNGNLRQAVCGMSDRPAGREEIARMTRLLEQGLEEGAIGYSTGLEYATEQGCSEEEVQALCRATGRRGGFYATHTRNRPGEAVETIAEAIRAAQATGVSLQISHLASVARLDEQSTWAVEQAIEQVERARAAGLRVHIDMHTRSFGTTNLSSILPPWALQGDQEAIAARLRDPAARDRMRAHPSIITSQARGDWSRIILFRCRSHPEFSQQSVQDIATRQGKEPFDAIFDLLLDEIDDLHQMMVISFAYQEDDLHLPFGCPYCMAGSDAIALAPDGPLAGEVFHGAYTWAGYFYRTFVREKQWMTPQEAIHRMTGLPAEKVGLKGRGRIEVGARADLAIFDPESFSDRGTTFEPNQLAVGMRHVFVNGVPAVREGKITGLRAGQVIRSVC